VNAPRGQRVGRQHLTAEIDAPRILFKTGTAPDPERFNDDYAGLAPELIDFLAAQRARLVGIDTPSVDPFDDAQLLSHHALARHDMANLEGLVLGHVPPGLYTLVALPLRLEGADASPVRAVLLTTDGGDFPA
jgi:arylformamidase